MTLKLELASLDGLDATVATLYKKDGDKFVLDVEGLPDVSGLKRKNDELLAETKAEREKRQALEAEQAKAAEEAAKKNGEFQSLYEKTQGDLAKERETNAAFRETIRQKDISAAAQAIGSQLTRDTARAGLLAKEASPFIKHTDEGIKFEIGGVPVDEAKVLEHLKTTYPFLADGNQAGGGGAPGSGGGAAHKAGDFGGDKSERTAAIAAKFPELNQ